MRCIIGEPFLVAALLAQGLWAAGDGEHDICLVFGPSVDLLMWIPKPDSPPGPNGLRPLQLPTCMRRLFGAMLMSLVRPHVKPMLTDDQAATKRRGLWTKRYENIPASGKRMGGKKDEPAAPHLRG